MQWAFGDFIEAERAVAVLVIRSEVFRELRGSAAASAVELEVAELPDHPWYIAVQYHPEFQSKPLSPHPLFADFVRASLENRKARRGEPLAARVPVTAR